MRGKITKLPEENIGHLRDLGIGKISWTGHIKALNIKEKIAKSKYSLAGTMKSIKRKPQNGEVFSI